MPLKTKLTGANLMTIEELERFSSRISHDENGCWNWTGVITRTGYGEYWRKPIRSFTHRIVLELIHKDIRGLIPDHLCENSKCCNPSHIKLGTQGDNVMRGNSPHARNARKTHCKNGHELTPDNLLQRHDGYRECRACRPAIEQRRSHLNLWRKDGYDAK